MNKINSILFQLHKNYIYLLISRIILIVKKNTTVVSDQQETPNKDS